MKTPFYTSEKFSIETAGKADFDELVQRAAKRQEAEEKAKAEKEQKRQETLERVSGMSMKEYVEARQSGEIK